MKSCYTAHRSPHSLRNQCNLRIPCFPVIQLRWGLFSTLLILGCASSGRYAADGTELHNRNLSITQEAYPSSGAVILLDEARLTIGRRNGIPVSEILRHTVVKILNERGYSFANVVIPYDNDSRISRIWARTVLPDGQTMYLDRDHIYDTNLYPEYIFYSDVRAKRFTMPSVDKGCIVEYRWRKIMNDFRFWTRWPFQREEPVLHSRYSVQLPHDLDILWKVYGKDVAPEYDRSSSGTDIIHTWQASHVMPIIPEISMPPGDKAISHIMFSPVGVSSWSDVALWYHRISQDRFLPDASIRSLCNRLLNDTDDPVEQCERIFRFVRDHIRYVAIEIGLGGYQPRYASRVLQDRYGDCKDMSALLIAMGSVAGLDIRPVLISTWKNGQTDSSLVSPAHFNHVIAYARLPDGTVYWMDATEKKCAFSELPWYDQNRLALIVTKTGDAILQHTPLYAASYNTTHREWSIRISNSGYAEGSFRLTFLGAQANVLRNQMHELNPGALEAWVNQDLLSAFPITGGERIDIRNRDAFSEPLIITGRFPPFRMIQASGSAYPFHPDMFSAFDWHRLFSKPERQFDIDLKYPMQITDSIRLSYPPDWICISGAFTDSLMSQYGDHVWSFNIESAGNAVYQRSVRLNRTRIPAEEYGSFREFLFSVAMSDQNLVLFERIE